MLKNLLKSEFAKGAIILFICMNLFNLFNLIFNFFAGRMLGPEQYGILATLMSFLVIYSIPSEIIQNITSKYTTKFNEKKEKGKMKYAIKIFLKNSTLLAIISFIFLVLISIPISEELGINYWLIILTHILIFANFIGPIPKGILQGEKKFAKLGISLLIEGGTKLLLAVLLIYFGFAVLGAMQAVLFSALIGIIISFYFCKEIIKTKSEKTELKSIKIGPYFIFMWTLMIFLSLDIILAKYFLTPELAGKYAAISLIGKIIFMGTNPITRVMFPISSERYQKNQNTKEILFKSIKLTFILGFIGIFVYYFFSNFIISVLYGKEYIEIAKYIIYAGIAFLILALTNINFMYALSTNRTKNAGIVFFGILIQIVLFTLMHSNLNYFLTALVLSNIVMFILSFLLIRK